MNDDLHAEPFEGDIRRFLELRAGDIGGIRDADEMVEAIALQTWSRSPGRVRSVRLIWLLAAIGLIALMTAAAVFIGSQRQPIPRPGAGNGWVAFAVKDDDSRDRGGGYDIWIVRAGVEARRIIGFDNDRIRETCPTFSPDGTRLAYAEAKVRLGTSSDPPGAWFVVIATIDSAGSRVGSDVRIPQPGGVHDHACPRWSPDGRSIAYLDGGITSPELWIADVRGGSRKVADWPADAWAELVWAPDGMAVAAANDAGVWLVPIAGGKPSLLIASGPDLFLEGMKWSPDATQMAVSGARYHETGDTRVRVESTRIFRVDDPRQQTEIANASDLAWSPDGRRIAYFLDTASVSDPGETTAVVVTSLADGTDVRVISDRYESLSTLTWSPDGTTVLFVGGDRPWKAPMALLSIPVAGNAKATQLWSTTTGFYLVRQDSITWQPDVP